MQKYLIIINSFIITPFRKKIEFEICFINEKMLKKQKIK